MISRRTFLHSSLATAVSAAALGSAYRLSRVAAPSGPPMPIPPLLDGRADGGLTVYELAARRGSTEFIAGAPNETFGYNGDILGPVLRMRRGDEVAIDVTNELGEPTTCHWHGLHVPAAMDGGPHQVIAPGNSWRATFPIDNEAATYWYHSHLEGRTGEQVYKGLAGMIIVDDPDLGTLELPSRYGIDDIPVVVQDRRISADGELRYAQMGMDMMMGMAGNRMVINGVLDPTARVPAQKVRLRLLNGSNARSYNFGFEDYRVFQVIGTDGGLLAEPLDRRRLPVSTGERYEIVVDFSDVAGETLRLMSYPGGDASDFTVLEFFVDPDIDTVDANVPEVLREQPAIEPAISVERDFVLEMGMGMMGGGMRGRGGGGGPGFTINGASMDMNVVNEVVKLGDVELWNITNNSPMLHPFHIHDVQFLVQSRDTGPVPAHERGWKDTVRVGPGRTVSVLAHFTDYADAENPYMYHCHILEHEDRGMMGQFTVVE